MAMFPSSSNWQGNVSPLEILITRACNPSIPEPNYALHLEVAEYINQKKANTPREAAMLIARLVNHRNPHIAMLALALLETLVQSCGYPFHLQISTKEFLNELVRRFPERPPPFPGPVMSRILELIHDWKEGICTESRWKEDLGNIRDMHRLLSFKGYRFRDLPRRPATAAATAAANLKSAEELENEDREAQSAKLQELIRRGTPRDLAAAQELMKTLAGANPEAKPDYRTQALTELNKLESKVILLNELLDNVDTTNRERFAQGDAYDQVATILTNARPKIQGWISNAEETDDPESLDTFLQINDQINTVLNRYDAFKKGDYAAASNPIPAELSNRAGANAGMSLIDFDDSAPSDNGPPAQPSGAPSEIDELASLFGPASSTPAAQPVVGMNFAHAPGGGVSMGSMMAMHGGPTNAPLPSFASPSHSPLPHGPGFGAPQTAHPGAATPQGAMTGIIRLGSPAIGAGIGTSPLASPMGSRASQPQTMHPQQLQYQPQAAQANQTQAQGKDPFADLVGLF